MVRMGLPQPSQEVDTLLGFLTDGAGVEGPGMVVHQGNSKKCGVLNDLHGGTIDDQWRAVTSCSPEDDNHLFSLIDAQRLYTRQ